MTSFCGTSNNLKRSLRTLLPTPMDAQSENTTFQRRVLADSEVEGAGAQTGVVPGHEVQQHQHNADMHHIPYQHPPFLPASGAPPYLPNLPQHIFYNGHPGAQFWSYPQAAPTAAMPTGHQWVQNTPAEATSVSIRAAPRPITPTNDHDLVVAGSIAVRQRIQSVDGAPSRKDALDALDGTQGHSAAEWKDYYLNRMEHIDAIIRATTAPLPQLTTLQILASPTTAPSDLPVPQHQEKDTAPALGIRIRIPSARRKAQASKEVIEIVDDSPRKPAPKSRKVSATKSGRRSKTQKALEPGPPKVDYKDRNKAVTVGDLDDVAQWIVSHGDAWSTMNGSQRWKSYAGKNKKRSYSAWHNVSKYYEAEIALRVATLRKANPTDS